LPTIRPRRREFNPVNFCKNVDAQRWNSDLKHRSRCCKIPRSQILKRCAVRFESGEGATSILDLWTNPNIKILGCTDVSVRRQGMCSHDQIIDAMVVEYA